MKTTLLFEIDTETFERETRGDGGPASVDFDSRGRVLVVAAGTWAGLVRVETLEVVHVLAGIAGRGRLEGRVRFLAHDRRVVAFVRAGDDRSSGLRMWDATDGSEIERIAGDAVGPILATSDDGNLAIVAAAGQDLALWDLQTLRHLHSLVPYRFSVTRHHAVAIAPGGRFALVSQRIHEHETGRISSTLRVWDLDRGTSTDDLRPHSAPIDSIAFFSRTGRALMIGDGADPVIHEDAGSRPSKVVRRYENLECPLGVAAATADGKAFAVFPSDAAARFVRVGDGTSIAFATPRDVTDACFSPDGRVLVAVGEKGLVRGWTADLTDPRQYR